MPKHAHSLKMIFEDSVNIAEYVDTLQENQQLDEIIDPITGGLVAAGVTAAAGLAKKVKQDWGGWKGALKSIKNWGKGPHQVAMQEFGENFPNWNKPDMSNADFEEALRELKAIYDGIQEDKTINATRKKQMIDTVRGIIKSALKDLRESKSINEDLGTPEGDAALDAYEETGRLSRRAAAAMLLGQMTYRPSAPGLKLPKAISHVAGKTASEGEKGPEEMQALKSELLNMAEKLKAALEAAETKTAKKDALGKVLKRMEKLTKKGQKQNVKLLKALLSKKETKPEQGQESSKKSPSKSEKKPETEQKPSAEVQQPAPSPKEPFPLATDSLNRDGEVVLERWQRIAGVL